MHYLARAYGSAEETIEHLRFLLETGSASSTREDCQSMADEYETLSRKLFNYMRAVEREHDPEWSDEGKKNER